MIDRKLELETHLYENTLNWLITKIPKSTQFQLLRIGLDIDCLKIKYLETKKSS